MNSLDQRALNVLADSAALAEGHRPPLPEGWRDFITDDERQLTNRWSMWGSDCIAKLGRLWDSGVPGAPLFKTRRAAHDFLTTFVCDAIPRRCVERFEAARRSS